MYQTDMNIQSLYQTFNRYRTLQTDKISTLPIVILMPHSACNCRCVMCDIWKGNNDLKRLTEEDISALLISLRRLNTQQVPMSGGEALLHPAFFSLCEILKKKRIKISLLSTGLTLKRNAEQLVKWVDDIIVSIDGDEMLHDAIRNIPGAFSKLKEGVHTIKKIAPAFKITGRTVIHKINYLNWHRIIDSAKEMGLDGISFLPADVSSTAFNRDQPWDKNRQHELLLSQPDLVELKSIIDNLLIKYRNELKSKFIVESQEKIQKIYQYYAAYHGLNDFPFKKCNAPWVSAVVESDGTVRPCFFHRPYGNIKTAALDGVINSDSAVEFRKNLDMARDQTCVKCVCYLNLSPAQNVS